MRANPLVSSLRDHVQCALERFLVNRYKDGLDHIGEHRDSERDLEPTAPIASLSFGQLRDFVLRHQNSRGGRGGGGGERERERERERRRRRRRRRREGELVKLELCHRSLLLVMCHPTNSQWYHSLPVRRRVLHPRIIRGSTSPSAQAAATVYSKASAKPWAFFYVLSK